MAFRGEPEFVFEPKFEFPSKSQSHAAFEFALEHGFEIGIVYQLKFDFELVRKIESDSAPCH